MLAPGDALFARPEVLATLTVPESALQVRYYHQDHLGSSSVLTDAAGALVSETANYAFGFARNEFLPRNLREPYGFTQKERDTESQFDYLERRYLVCATGLFLSFDRYLEDGIGCHLDRPTRLNGYRYANSNPIRFNDPSGEWAIAVPLIAGAVAFAVEQYEFSKAIETQRKLPAGHPQKDAIMTSSSPVDAIAGAAGARLASASRAGVSAASGGAKRVTYFYDPAKGGFGPATSRLPVTQQSQLSAILEGGSAGPRTWVSPRAASEQSWFSRHMTGVGNRRHFVEFDALPGELNAASSTKLLHGKAGYQSYFKGEVNLTGRNASFGVADRNLLDEGVRATAKGAAIGGGLSTLRSDSPPAKK